MSSQASPATDSQNPEPAGWMRAAVALLALAFFVWPYLIKPPLTEGGAVGNELIYDGLKLVTGHEVLARIPSEPSAILETLTTPWWGDLDPGQALYRPASSFVLGLGALVSGEPYNPYEPGMSPVPFKLFALALKVICALLVLDLAWRLLGSAKAGLCAGLLFATLPVHGEVLFDVAGTAELLAAAFSIAAWIAWVKAGPAPLQRPGQVVLAALFAFLAVNSKESAYALPLVLFLADIGGARAGGIGAGLRHAVAKLPALAIVVLALVGALGIRYAVLGTLTSEYGGYNELDNPLLFTDAPTRVMNGLRLMATSIPVMLGINPLSSNFNYTIDYGLAQIVPQAAFSVGNLIGAGALAAIVLLAVVLYPRCRTRAALALALLGSLLLTSNVLFPIGTIFAERLLFFPSVLAVLFVAPFFARLGSVGVAVTLLLSLGGGFWSLTRAPHYATPVQTWSYTSRTTSKDSARAHYNLGVAEILEQNALVQAGFSFERATELYPDFVEAHAGRGELYGIELKWDQAADSFQTALDVLIERADHSYEPEGGIGQGGIAPSMLLYQLTQLRAVEPGLDREGHLAYLDGLLERGYQSPYVAHRRAETLRSLGRYEEAEQAFVDSIEIEPTPSAIGAYASFLRRLGRDSEAREFLGERIAELEARAADQTEAARAEFLLLRGDAELLEDPRVALATAEAAQALDIGPEPMFRARLLEAQALSDIVAESPVDQARNNVRAADALRLGLADVVRTGMVNPAFAQSETTTLALQILVQLEMEQDNRQAAKAVISDLLGRSEAPTLRARMGTLQIREGDSASAAKSLELAVEGLQKAADSGFSSGLFYLETRMLQLLNLRSLGDPDAEGQIAAALDAERARATPISWTVVIEWHLSQDEFTAGRDAVESLRASLPDEQKSQADAFAQVLEQMADVTARLGAERSDPALLEQLGFLRLQNADRFGAERELLRALELTPEDAVEERARRLNLLATVVEPTRGAKVALNYLDEALALPGLATPTLEVLSPAAERLRVLMPATLGQPVQ